MENHNHEALISKLLDCALACENCASACLQEDDVKAMAACIKLDRDCADICIMGARLLKRGSDVAHQFLVLCEEICRMCGEECNRHEHWHCKDCAAACIACADACHEHHQPVTQD